MLRVTLLILCLLGSAAAIACALLIPSHLRSMDEQVLVQSGRGSGGVVEAGVELVPQRISSAKLLKKTADELNLTHTLRFTAAIQAAEATGSAWRTSPFRSPEFQNLLGGAADNEYLSKSTLLEVLRNRATRAKFQEALITPDAHRILQNLTITNLLLFAPAGSAGGLPFEVAVLSAAMLVDDHALGADPTSRIKDQILSLVKTASRTNSNPALEEFYLNIFALAKRLTWEQTTLFTSHFKTLEALDFAVRWIQQNNAELPVVFTAVHMAQNGERVSNYLELFGEEGRKDIEFAMKSGARPLLRILELQQPVYHPEFRESLVRNLRLEPLFESLLKLSTASPTLAQFLKLDLLVLGAFLITLAFKYIRKPSAENYVWFQRFAFARQLVFTALLVMLMVILGEPYLVQGEAKEQPAQVQWNLPMLAEALTTTPQTSGSMITASTLITLGVFFVLQVSIYIIGLVKLAEIQRQPLSSTMKLKLLDNEENLFDAGLYCGLFGTASSLVLLTLGVIKPSLMSAYASTLFGILFVAILKILHVRPYKRRLILETQPEVKAA